MAGRPRPADARQRTRRRECSGSGNRRSYPRLLVCTDYDFVRNGYPHSTESPFVRSFAHKEGGEAEEWPRLAALSLSGPSPSLIHLLAHSPIP